MNNNLGKSITDEEEVKLEGIIKLLPCQKALKFHPDDYSGIGIQGYCKIGEVTFYDRVYMSKYVITETCNKKCPYCKDQ